MLDLRPRGLLIGGERLRDVVLVRGAELGHLRALLVHLWLQRVELGLVVGLARFARLGHRLLVGFDERGIVLLELLIELVDRLLLCVRQVELCAVALGKRHVPPVLRHRRHGEDEEANHHSKGLLIHSFVSPLKLFRTATIGGRFC